MITNDSVVKVILVDPLMDRISSMLPGLSQNPQIRVLGFAQNGEQGVTNAAKYGADVILTCMVPDMTMEQFMDTVRKESPGTDVFYILDYFTLDVVQQSNNAGITQVYNRETFSIGDATGDMVRHVTEKRLKYEKVAQQNGILQPGRGAEQRTVIRELHTTAIRQTVTLTYSPKGGVGKTTLATNLAVAMKMSPYMKGQRIVLVDFDLASGNLNTQFRIDHREILQKHLARWDSSDLEQMGVEELNELLVDGPAGIKIAVAPINFTEGDSVTPERADRILALLKRHFDQVIIDGAPSLTDPVDMAMNHATHILGVVNPEGQSIQQIATAINIMRNPEVATGMSPEKYERVAGNFKKRLDKLHLVMNHTRPLSKHSVPTADIATSLNKMILAEIPYEADAILGALHKSQNIQAIQYAPNSEFASSIRSLAQSICGAYPAGWEKGTSLLTGDVQKPKSPFFGFGKKR